MKVLIVSDSHGLTKELEKLIEKHHGEVDTFIHCGDSELDPDDPALKNFIIVRGNCDFDERFPEDRIKTIGNRTILITHGHRYSVKSSLMKLSYKAKEVLADIACFGHSHQLGAEMVHGTLFINPGSIRLPRGRREKTYVILAISEESYQLKVYDIDKGEISELSQVFSLSS
ncbi:metallophosphoesterase [Bacillus sp. V3B]|uniref:metallophosphoesterase n=1 Tax=Bacillus sp. V3B TaxID=2804915 RepID=UPI00210C50B3|nr:metallophosphoesterase [Bacillus sp. V3B]MCQ6273483.1 metallophosphoesterase [Bacillus sp. V3B]